MGKTWDPPMDELADTIRRSVVTLEHWDKTLDEFLATGKGAYDTPAENLASIITMLTHYDVSIPEMMNYLVWRLVREGREPELEELYGIADKQWARIGLIQIHSMAEGWRFDDEEELLEMRLSVWAAARSELDSQLAQARAEREQRGGVGARLGRALRRPG